MKLRFIQKMVAGALTVALVAAPSMSALASPNYGNDYGNSVSRTRFLMRSTRQSRQTATGLP